MTCTVLMAAWLAAQHAAADEASHRAAVERLFSLTHMQQLIDESVHNVASLQLQQNPQLEARRAELTAFLQGQIGWEALHADLVQMYLQAFSEQELETINAFYATPAGQKVISTVPQLVAERNRLAMQRLQDNREQLRGILAGDASP